jgi:hypothetical protein
MSPQMDVLVRGMFDGWMQSRIIEDCNQKLRDHESRDNASKVLRHVALWRIPSSHELIRSYGRDEACPSHFAAQVPAADTMERLFVQSPPRSVAQLEGLSVAERNAELIRKAWDDRLRKVTEKHDWQTFNPAGKAQLVAEMSAMLHAHEHNAWDDLANIWQSRVVPQHQLCRHKVKKHVFFTLCVFDCAVLNWPAKQIEKGMWSFDMDIVELKWEFVQDVKNIEILPTKVVAPLHSFLQKAKSALRIKWVQTSPPLSLIDWQSQRGFPNVPEIALKKLFAVLGIEMPDETQTDDYRMELKMGLIAHCQPTFDEFDAMKVINEAHMVENSDASSGDLDLSPEMVRDVVVPSECAEVSGWSKQCEIAKVSASVHRRVLKKVVSKYFKPRAKAKGKAKGSVPAPMWKAPQAAMTESATKFIRDNRPPGATVVVHQQCGKWEVSYPGSSRKSFSWGSRGHNKAVALTLHHLWTQHCEATFEEAPWSLAQMAKVAGLA